MSLPISAASDDKGRKILIGIGKLLLVFIVVGVVIYLIPLITARPAPVPPWFAPRPVDHTPLAFAHQGGENIRPSNTLEAFRHAVEFDADALDYERAKMKKAGKNN